MSLIIRREEEKDHRAVEELTREAFWNVYHPGATEHLIVHQLRNKKHVIKDLNLVAEADGSAGGAYPICGVGDHDRRRSPAQSDLWSL